MATFRITAPDGTVYRVTAPEGATEQDALERVQAQHASAKQAPSPVDEQGEGFNRQAAQETLIDTARNIGAGALKGAANIGATIMRPVDAALNAVGATDTTNVERRARLADFFKENADPESLAFKGGELGAEIAGTAGIGGALAKGARAVGAAPKLISALETGGFRLGGPAATTAAGKAGEAALRAGAGAAVGGASAGLIDPSQAGVGAAIGGVAPIAVKTAGALGSKVLPKVGAEVAALAQRAKALGIDIPADRLVNSRPLNAAAASLNYVPLSGRAGAEERMVSQLNRAVSKTFGQDSDNVTAALRKAGTALGDKFDLTLKGNKVVADTQLVDDLAAVIDKADRTLTKDGIRIIGKQVDEILGKVDAGGKINGEAAYIIKRELDDIARGGGTEATAARDLKLVLMDALNRSLGPTKAAEFAAVRKQYGNMLALENIAQNGAEGGVSIARLANMKNINNAELQELADIASQFVKTRESPHGAMQRVVIGAVAGPTAFATGNLPLLATGIAGGRAANTALNSNTIKNLLMNPAAAGQRVEALGADPTLRALLYSAPNRLGGSNP